MNIDTVTSKRMTERWQALCHTEMPELLYCCSSIHLQELGVQDYIY